MSHPSLPESRTFALTGLAVLVLVAAVYWPAHAAGFVWDDYKFLLDSGWMTDRSYWPHLIAHGFPEWASYYRPLGVVLYLVETNAADFQPMPMHLLSLGIHFLNTAMVGLLARRLLWLRAPEATSRIDTVALPGVAMQKRFSIVDKDSADFVVTSFQRIAGNDYRIDGFEEIHSIQVDGYKIGAVYKANAETTAARSGAVPSGEPPR